MTDPTLLAASWSDGVFVFSGETRQQEFPGQSVHALMLDGRGGSLVFANGHSICQTGSEGSWTTNANRDRALVYRLTVGKAIYVGKYDDGSMLYLIGDDEFTRPPVFDTVAERDAWFAGSAAVKKSSCRTNVGGVFNERNLGRDCSFRQCSRRLYLKFNKRR